MSAFWNLILGWFCVSFGCLFCWCTALMVSSRSASRRRLRIASRLITYRRSPEPPFRNWRIADPKVGGVVERYHKWAVNHPHPLRRDTLRINIDDPMAAWEALTRVVDTREHRIPAGSNGRRFR